VSAPDDLRRADSFYAQVGGEDTFRRLVHAFYAGVGRTSCSGRCTPTPT
jgi:truncated hemoglobin YjbI